MYDKEIPKGTNCCNKGCFRCGNLNREECEDCYKKCMCDKCNDDIRKTCYQKYIIENDTSLT